MNIPSYTSQYNTLGVQPASSRAPVEQAAAARLSAAEEAQIADAFPARPQVEQKLYGPGRGVHQPAQIGARLDLSA
ncbi:hypothetical protein [Rubrivirga sp.]|uniref:hypothetical protein n=1 Tax=Rubrivirga sp. TaxID=1885344 RepID=UPI003C78B37B